jgi:tetratricopeptide (TPR) repeat protein
MYVRIVSSEAPTPTDRRTAGGCRRRAGIALGLLGLLAGCDRASTPASSNELRDEPAPAFRNVANATEYVGDSACTACHAAETRAYRQHAMSRSFHRWTPSDRIEAVLDSGIVHGPTGLSYTIAEIDGKLHQVEFIPGPAGRRLHELRRPIDWVMGSGEVARSYFTEENGRLFQLPLTWYRRHGWDFSPGYQINNARFDRSMPDRCIACHSSYPRALPYLEGKYAEMRPGIGCQRCHGPGALHVQERRTGITADTGYDNTIVNPARLPLARRMDVCEQCHVHTTVSVLREGQDAFSFLPSQALRDQWAFFKVAGSIDIVSHADRLRQSACFLETRSTPSPLECATCHNPHDPPAVAERRNQPCLTCHSADSLQRRLARSSALAEHAPSANCVSCHMPRTAERGVPHGTFTDHWIRVATRAAPATVQRAAAEPIEPYYDRDKESSDGAVYRGLGGIVYGTLASDSRALANAAAALDRAIGSDTTRGEAFFLLGTAYEQLGKTPEAIRALERSVRADSNHPDRLRALATAYRATGRPATEIDHLYRRTLELQPALAWVRAEYATFLREIGRRDDAIAAYREALAEQPSLASAWFNLATVLAEPGPGDDAADAFRRAIQLDPSLGEAASSLFEVQRTNGGISNVRLLGSPFPSLPVRDRGPRAVRMSVTTDAGVVGLRIYNVPPRSQVRIVASDGSLVRALPVIDGWSHTWDLRSQRGTPIAGGLYRLQVQGRDPTGKPFAPFILPFGVVSRRAQ